MKIQVKAEHIREGQRESCEHCPVAYAASEAFDMVAECSYEIIYLWDGRKYRLPKSVTNKIANYDGGRAMKPFCFTLTKKNELQTSN